MTQRQGSFPRQRAWLHHHKDRTHTLHKFLVVINNGVKHFLSLKNDPIFSKDTEIVLKF